MVETIYEDFDDAGYSIETDGQTIDIETAKGTEASLTPDEAEQFVEFAGSVEDGFDDSEDIGDYTVVGHSEGSRFDAMICSAGAEVRGMSIFGLDMDGEHIASVETQHVEDALDAVAAEA